MKYQATVGFVVTDIEAQDIAGVEEVLNKLIDQLSAVKTDVVWDDVDWLINELEFKE